MLQYVKASKLTTLAAMAALFALQTEPLSESDVARIVRSAMATPAPTPAPTAQPTPAPTEAPVMAMMPVESRLKVAINVPQYGENILIFGCGDDETPAPTAAPAPAAIDNNARTYPQ